MHTSLNVVRGRLEEAISSSNYRLIIFSRATLQSTDMHAWFIATRLLRHTSTTLGKKSYTFEL